MTKLNFKEIGNQVKDFLMKKPETLYNCRELVELLELDITPRSLSLSLSRRHKELGLLKVYVHDYYFRSYFAFSEKCGSNACYYDWCDEVGLCKIDEKNPDLKFYHEL